MSKYKAKCNSCQTYYEIDIYKSVKFICPQCNGLDIDISIISKPTIDSNGQLHFNQGLKFDGGKLRYDLVPVDSLRMLAEVLTYGARKYADNSWKNVKPFEDRYYGALLRHLMAWRSGELLDPESGLPHLAHAMCNIVFLLEGGEA